MKYSVHRKLLCELLKFSKLNAFILLGFKTNTDAFCLQIPPRENWFQYVRRVYATAINFPCLSLLYHPLWVTLYLAYTWYKSIKVKMRD